jgi:hypothetical protein
MEVVPSIVLAEEESWWIMAGSCLEDFPDQSQSPHEGFTPYLGASSMPGIAPVIA